MKTDEELQDTAEQTEEAIEPKTVNFRCLTTFMVHGVIYEQGSVYPFKEEDMDLINPDHILAVGESQPQPETPPKSAGGSGKKAANNRPQ